MHPLYIFAVREKSKEVEEEEVRKEKEGINHFFFSSFSSFIISLFTDEMWKFNINNVMLFFSLFSS